MSGETVKPLQRQSSLEAFFMQENRIIKRTNETSRIYRRFVPSASSRSSATKGIPGCMPAPEDTL
jgi:hypothetical protein